MRAVDTNVLVRLLARDHPKQTEAAEKFVAKGAWISHVVLVEAIWVLQSVYGLKQKSIADAIEMLLNHRDLTFQDADTIVLALAMFRRKPSPGFSDCLILEVARKAGHLPLGTFDRGLGKLDDTDQL
jgi:predicted nucleic-acid-binding protein